MAKPKLKHRDAAHRLQSCEALKEHIREQMLLGTNNQPAVPKINPNRITVEFLEQPVLELDKVTRKMEEQVEELTPGEDFWLPLEKRGAAKWYWSGVDDLARLRARVDFYLDALDHAATLPVDDARVFLAEFVYTPIFYGSRHKNVADANSPWIYTTADFCEPARIYKNWVYAVELSEEAGGLWPVISAVGETIYGYFNALVEFSDDVSHGVERLVVGAGRAIEAVGRNIKPISIGAGVILLGVGIFFGVREFRGKG